MDNVTVVLLAFESFEKSFVEKQVINNSVSYEDQDCEEEVKGQYLNQTSQKKSQIKDYMTPNKAPHPTPFSLTPTDNQSNSKD